MGNNVLSIRGDPIDKGLEVHKLGGGLGLGHI